MIRFNRDRLKKYKEYRDSYKNDIDWLEKENNKYNS